MNVHDGSRLLDGMIVLAPFIVMGIVAFIKWEWNRK